MPENNNYPPMAPQQREHKGIFGIKGRGRDILGLIGDAFLTQANKDPIYRPRRDREIMSDSLQGFADNPLSAIQRLNDMGFPAEAAKMHDQYQEQQVKMRETKVKENEYGDKVLSAGTAFLDPRVANAETWPAVRKRVQDYYAARGVTPPFELPEQYDENAIANIRAFGVPTKDQVDDAAMADYRKTRLEQIDTANRTRQQAVDSISGYREEQIENMDEDNNRGDEIANTPTPTKVVGAALEKYSRGVTLSPTEQRLVDRHLNGTPGKGKGGRSAPGIPPMSPSSNKGKTAVAPDGVTKYRSDGKQWIKIN